MKIAGRMMDGTIAEHVRACEVLIEQEQYQVMPNNHLISVLCESVRMSREYCDFVGNKPASTGERG